MRYWWKQTNKQRVCFGSGFGDPLHCGREGMVAEMWDHWSQWILHQKMNALFHSLPSITPCGMTSSTFSVVLPSSGNFFGNVLRQTQRCVLGDSTSHAAHKLHCFKSFMWHWGWLFVLLYQATFIFLWFWPAEVQGLCYLASLLMSLV